ncbi:MAG TPA: hypothetical protein VHV30_09705, partial [Polyangiaceae bacterium]|nr:hypothetical protein [Polyangiaceae bacterium]
MRRRPSLNMRLGNAFGLAPVALVGLALLPPAGCGGGGPKATSGDGPSRSDGGSSGSGSGAGSSSGGITSSSGASSGGTFTGDDGGGTTFLPRCTAAGQCIQDCSAGSATTLTGTVYDPAGKNPLYGVAVYVPSTTPMALPAGASCNSCSGLYTGDPIASAITDAAGHFAIDGVPDGTDVPLV